MFCFDEEKVKKEKKEKSKIVELTEREWKVKKKKMRREFFYCR